MRELAVVTTVHRYGQYLEEWAASILASTQLPGEIVIIDHGNAPPAWPAIDRAVALLQAAGLSVIFERIPQKLDFGIARNRAVALAATPWVMHLDADDMVMPHCFATIEKLAPSADVVSLAYQRCGDLASGPTARVKGYRFHQGEATRRDPTPSSGCSPFRKTFWEVSPYPTDQLGGWDTALWLNFSRQEARFVPTAKPCFWYRQHADSLFNTRRKSGWPAAVVGSQLQSRRRGDDGVALIVPRAADDPPERVAAWDYLKARYQRERPDWEVREGTLPPGNLWCKGAAVAKALEGCRARTLIVADADCLLSLEALDRAVAEVDSAFCWVVPHMHVYRLKEEETKRWLAKPEAASFELPAAGELVRGAYVGFAGGGCFVVSRPVFEAAGGIPKIFVGWGGEDEAVGIILSTLIGPPVRYLDPLVHLWHPSQGSKTRPTITHNLGLVGRYREARGKPDLMWGLVASGRAAYLTSVPFASRPSRMVAGRAAVADTFATRRLARNHHRSNSTEHVAMKTPHDNKMVSHPGLTKRRFETWAAYFAAANCGLTDADFGNISGKVTSHQVRAVAVARKRTLPKGDGVVVRDERGR